MVLIGWILCTSEDNFIHFQRAALILEKIYFVLFSLFGRRFDCIQNALSCYFSHLILPILYYSSNSFAFPHCMYLLAQLSKLAIFT